MDISNITFQTELWIFSNKILPTPLAFGMACLCTHLLRSKPGSIFPTSSYLGPGISTCCWDSWLGHPALHRLSSVSLPFYLPLHISPLPHFPALILSRIFSLWELELSLKLINIKLRRPYPSTFAPFNCFSLHF